MASRLVPTADNPYDAARREIVLGGATVVVGRGGQCSVVLHSDRLSRIHCALHWRARQWVLEDLGSSGGSYVIGELIPIGPTGLVLCEGDEIRIGGLRYELRQLERWTAELNGGEVVGMRDSSCRGAGLVALVG